MPLSAHLHQRVSYWNASLDCLLLDSLEVSVVVLPAQLAGTALKHEGPRGGARGRVGGQVLTSLFCHDQLVLSLAINHCFPLTHLQRRVNCSYWDSCVAFSFYKSQMDVEPAGSARLDVPVDSRVSLLYERRKAFSSGGSWSWEDEYAPLMSSPLSLKTKCNSLLLAQWSGWPLKGLSVDCPLTPATDIKFMI